MQCNKKCRSKFGTVRLISIKKSSLAGAFQSHLDIAVCCGYRHVDNYRKQLLAVLCHSFLCYWLHWEHHNMAHKGGWRPSWMISVSRQCVPSKSRRHTTRRIVSLQKSDNSTTGVSHSALCMPPFRIWSFRHLPFRRRSHTDVISARK